jgi:hypothetical protein
LPSNRILPKKASAVLNSEINYNSSRNITITININIKTIAAAI